MREQVNTIAARDRVTAWEAFDEIPNKGNLFITSLPNVYRFETAEVDLLQSWVESGNTLLLMAALDDTPAWSLMANPSRLRGQFRALTGLRLQTVTDDEGDPILLGSVTEASEIVFTPVSVHPLMQGVSSLRAYTEAPSAIWELNLDREQDFVAVIAREATSGVAAIWELPRSAGRILVSASGTLFTNRMLGSADNGQFLINIVNTHLQPGGAVIFDDMHQGETDIYDATAFFGDTRLYYTIAFLLAFWLIYLVGSSPRLAPPIETRRRPRQSDVVYAASAFMSRKLSDIDAGLLMVEQWLQELQLQGLIPKSASIWDQLELANFSDRGPLTAIRNAYTQLQQGTSVDLVTLHNNIKQVRRMME